MSEKKDEILINEFVSFIDKTKNLVENFIIVYAKEILACDDEREFLSMLSKIADDLYKGNVIVEAIDGIIFNKIFQGIDKYILDKYIGEDWFIKLQTKAKNIIDNKE